MATRLCHSITHHRSLVESDSYGLCHGAHSLRSTGSVVAPKKALMLRSQLEDPTRCLHLVQSAPTTLPRLRTGNFMQQYRPACSPPHPSKTVLDMATEMLRRVLAGSAAAIVLLQCNPPAFAVPVQPSSEAEIESAKATLVSAWNIVKDTYVDGTFNNQNWETRLEETIEEISALQSKEEAYAKIKGMLATLEDPYTRIVSPRDYKSFQISKDGSVEGVGLLLGSDQATGRLIVLSPIQGGPAAKAGILSGDELIQIDGQSIVGMNGEEAAARLRGRVGTPVTLRLHRQAGSIGGEVGGEATKLTDIKINLLREKIFISPVSMAVLSHKLPDGQITKIGYIHLSSFSQNAPDEMKKAILRLEEEGADSYVLDLRNNPGGLVRSGLEVAEMWLDGDDIVVNTLDRNSNMETIRLGNSHPLTDDPLVVLVNGETASASEILAGALHDNGRALLLGERSFGKGKIQSVTELKDGSGLFVTIAQYLSPSFLQIDKTGLLPDVQCAANDLQLPLTHQGSLLEDTNAKIVQLLEQDSCLITAEEQLGMLSSS